MLDVVVLSGNIRLDVADFHDKVTILTGIGIARRDVETTRSRGGISAFLGIHLEGGASGQFLVDLASSNASGASGSKERSCTQGSGTSGEEVERIISGDRRLATGTRLLRPPVGQVA